MRSIDNRRLRSISPENMQKIKDRLKNLSDELARKSADQRTAYINSKREEAWGAEDLKQLLFSAVGSKCWYSEISLAGSDVNIDHFRPKGKIREIDYTQDFVSNGNESDGYWWLAFDIENFRLSSQHANQRRVDEETQGGKWDFFPVVGARATSGVRNSLIQEKVIALDPCSASDVRLLAFDSFGKPIWSGFGKNDESFSRLRVKLSIWLYHLNKKEINIKRSKAVEEMNLFIDEANDHHTNWQAEPDNNSLKATFDKSIARIIGEISQDSEFSSAKRYKVKLRMVDYEWISEYIF